MCIVGTALSMPVRIRPSEGETEPHHRCLGAGTERPIIFGRHCRTCPDMAGNPQPFDGPIRISRRFRADFLSGPAVAPPMTDRLLTLRVQTSKAP